MPLSSMEEALADLKAGKFLVVVDDEKRENEGDLVMAAEMVTPDAVNFLVKYGRGLLCMPMKSDRLDELGIKLIESEHAPHEMPTAFTMSVDYKVGTTTGISAADRAATVNALIDPEARPRRVFPPRPSFSSAIPAGRRFCPSRAHRGDCRLVFHSRYVPSRRCLRNNERRRVNVTPA